MYEIIGIDKPVDIREADKPTNLSVDLSRNGRQFQGELEYSRSRVIKLFGRDAIFFSHGKLEITKPVARNYPNVSGIIAEPTEGLPLTGNIFTESEQ
jgi:hypothetical protein